MDIMPLAVAGVAALAIVLLAVGVATSGGSGISDRLERYAAKPTAGAKSGTAGSVTSARTSPGTSPEPTSSSSRPSS